jgi:hypothetical protein
MATWDDTFSLKTLVPGLSESLASLTTETKAALDVERRAKNELMNSLNTKVNDLQNLINQAQTLINNIAANLDDTGVHVLDIPAGTGGFNSLINTISGSTNKPMTPSSGFYAGKLLIVTAPDVVQVGGYYNKLQRVFTIKS